MSALIDEGAACFAAVSEFLFDKLGLPVIDSVNRRIKGATSEMVGARITAITALELEIAGYRETIYAYVVPNLEYPMVLGNPWKALNRIRTAPEEGRFYHGRAGKWIKEWDEGRPAWVKRRLEGGDDEKGPHPEWSHMESGEEVEIHAVAMSDIDKALKEKPPLTDEELRGLVPPQFHDLLPLFSKREADKLPPHRPGVDHKIELKNDKDGNPAPLPWGPLYGMSKEELLVLKKTLRDLLDKGYIRPSSSSAGAPILFVRKPNGGLRFCCDYRAINAISESDRYPLPLIAETLRNLSECSWISKVDVIAAFHKIRVAEGQEFKTAFRTRYGLFEWLVTPFGLSGAPATFQRYINDLLRDVLDDFASAYADDVIIYTKGTKDEHMEKVRVVLQKLFDGGLHLDPEKSEFGVKRIKYLGFIVNADGKGVEADPEKVQAVENWERPSTKKEVRRFLGFANYYRIFIPDYSAVAAALTALTGKDTPFTWGSEQERAFKQLKHLFSRAPVLRGWDPEAPTFLEADSSGFAIGGTVSQEHDGIRYPIGFHSRKLGPSEINYDIHDKELLAVIDCMKFWDAELRGCGRFTVLTDHKNLEYFMVKRPLSERQARWNETLSRYRFSMVYRRGRDAIVPDALSRREQDGLDEDDRKSREMQLIPQEALTKWTEAETKVCAMRSNDGAFEKESWNEKWREVSVADSTYQAVVRALKDGERALPSGLRLKVQLSDCKLLESGVVLHRERIWVPGAPFTTEAEWKGAVQADKDLDLLRTWIIQACHDSPISGHPGREGTANLVGRAYYWPLMHHHIRRFCRNCDMCGRSNVWRDLRQGLLQPLPVPDRFWSEISMDFITDLPPSGGCTSLWVIKDRLSKNFVLQPMSTMKAPECAEAFLDCWVRHHGLPRAITSDRGTNWTSRFWRRMCERLGVEQRLSSAYHPQTDGGPERINQEVEAYLRKFINMEQSDWKYWCPVAQLALNGREHSAIGTTPFFATHGFHAPHPAAETVDRAMLPANSDEKKADNFVKKIRDITDACQALMGATNQRYEETANRKRNPATTFRVGDKVWLDLRNYTTDRPKRSLDFKNAKYTVAEVISPLSVRLSGIPRGIQKKFHPDLLKLVPSDPLPGQVNDDKRPDPVLIEGKQEWHIEEIRDVKDGEEGEAVVQVKWTGYQNPTWEPVSYVADTRAWKDYTAKHGPRPTGSKRRPRRGTGKN